MDFRGLLRVESFAIAWRWLRDNSPGTAKAWSEYDLRWSYIAVAGMAVVGFVINLTLANGWTVWPMVGVAGMLVYVHEAAERNGQGVPPLHVYSFFGAVVGVWVVFTAVLSVVNPLVLALGVGALGYYSAKGVLRQREARRVVEERRAAGLCVHCGEAADPTQGVCLNCGEEPNPEVMQLQRVQAVVTKGADPGRMRAVLKQDNLSVSAKRKEAALVRDRQSRRPGSGRKK